MPLTAPPPAPSRTDPTTFADRGDAWLAWQEDTLVPELNALETAVSASQTAAAASASAAATAETNAETAETNAEAAQAAAEDAQTAAEAAATTAASAPGTSASSVTSLTIGTGNQSLTIETGKSIVVGMSVKIAITASPTNWMAGDVTAYNSGTGALTVNVVRIRGSGSASAWTVSLSGAVGPITTSEAIIAYASSLTLTDLTLFSTAPHVIAPNNAPNVPDPMTTSDGWSVTTGFSAGSLRVMAPTSIATAHGTWGSDNAMVPPTLGTISGSAANTVVGTVQLDTDLVAVLYRNSSNFYAACVNTSTGAVTASPVTVAARDSDDGAAIFKVSTSSFVVFCQHAGSNSTVRAASVDTGTLVITQGSAQTTSQGFVGVTPVQLSSSLYVFVQSNANDLRAASVSGTTVTLGTAVASGAYTSGNNNVLRIAKSSATEFLAVYLASGGGTSTTRALTSRIGSVDGTPAITLNGASAGTNIENNAGLRRLLTLNEGVSYIAVAQNGAVTTSGDFYAVAVSSTTATTGAVTTRASDLPAAQTNIGTWIYQQTGMSVLKYNSTTALFGHLSAGPYAVTSDGSTLTFGSTLALGAAKTFLIDATAGTTFYARSSGVFDKISVSGTTIASAWQVAAGPTIIVSDTVTDKAVSYSSTWYLWSITAVAALTPTKWLFSSGNNLLFSGPVA